MRGLLAIFALSGALFGQVVINEIMFKPDPSDHEWVEIYNAGADPVDINGWYITDPGYSGRIVDSSFVIEPGEFVILTEYDTTFSCRTIYVDHWPYLNNSGDTIFLRDADSAIVDVAVYSVSSSWEHNVSIELIDYSADNSDPANWVACTDAAGATPCNPIQDTTSTKIACQKDKFLSVKVSVTSNTLYLLDAQKSEGSAYIYDINGKCVFKSRLERNKIYFSSPLPQGIYFLVIVSEIPVRTKFVVVE